jgi:predicted Mrr-cat superfamily restriction endonuclease
VNLQEYSTTITFREEWLDERLKFDDFRGELNSQLKSTAAFYRQRERDIQGV